MPSLRSLLQDIAPPTNRPIGVTYVYADTLLNNHSPCCGGACCLFTVPDGVTSVTFELWAGGGSGGNGSCRWPMRPAGAGGYARRTIATQPGCQYTVCAADRNGVCCTNGVGMQGCKSFVSGSGIATTCAWGGLGGCNCCYGYNATTCYGPCVTPSLCSCGDISISPIAASAANRGCAFRRTEFLSGAPFYGSAGASVNENGCCCRAPGANRGQASFPGGGGVASATCRCRACGSSGAAGIVKITYS